MTALAYLFGDGAMVDADLVEQYAWRATPTPRALQSSVYRLRQALGADVVISRYRRVQLNHELVQLDTECFLTQTADSSGQVRAALQGSLALVHGEPSRPLLGRHVRRRPGTDCSTCHVRGIFHQWRVAGDSKVDYTHPRARIHPLGDENVLRLDVAVQEPGSGLGIER